MKIKFFSLLVVLAFLFTSIVPSVAAAPAQIEALASAPNLVTQIRLAPASPNIVKLGQNVTVSFQYNTTAAGGVRIFARPFTGDALTPNYAACASPLYPVGSGTGTCSFTITSGPNTVNRIRFQIWNANQTTLLFQTFIPVNYQFKALGTSSTLVSTMSLVPTTANILKFGQNVTVRFRYNTTEAGGVRIFARPFSGAALTPNYAACPSPIYPVGSGSGSCTFTITSGAVVVSRIRFQVWNANQTKLLFEAFLPVSYQFKGNPTLVTNVSLAPPNPNILKFNQNITVGFRYNTTEAGGVRIFARPFTGAALTPNYAACASPIYPAGSGSGTCTFTITSGTTTVNRIRFQVWNANQTVLLFEGFIPVTYQFR